MSKRVRVEHAAEHLAHSLASSNCCECSKKVGAHISAAGGVFNTFGNNAAVNGRAFGCFLKTQRKWSAPPLSDSDMQKFNDKAVEFKFDKNLILPHGSYLINLGNPDEEMWKKSFDNFIDDILRCQKLGISLYNFHPGSTVGKCSVKDSLKKISTAINEAHKLVPDVIIVMETMAGQGNVVGSKFEELRDIISMIEDKSRIGVCIDTCHIFAAGYDIRSEKAYEKTMLAFDQTIGFEYLRGVHLNDSKADLRSGLDRHENIGKGKIGIKAFKAIMNDSRFDNVPMILETPATEGVEAEVYRKEIELLYSLIESLDKGIGSEHVVKDENSVFNKS